jgi:hypothetical protein
VLVIIKNVLIRALEHVDLVPLVKSLIIIQFVVVLKDCLEIHLYLVNIMMRSQKLKILVYHLHVGPIQFVKSNKIDQFVHVLLITLEAHHIAVLNVY